jgi:hypothetical protein
MLWPGVVAAVAVGVNHPRLKPGERERARKSQKVFNFLELRDLRGNSVAPALAFSGDIV